MKTKESGGSPWLSGTGPVLTLAALKVVIHLVVNAAGGYGYFRDELYYIACSKHLAFGYVDQPPLSIWLLAANRFLFGDSLFALRLLPALADGLAVFLAGLMTRELGGRRFAQVLAALAVFAARMISGICGVYSMNAFDILFWALGAYLLIRLLKSKNLRLWIPLGLVMGFGLFNKTSMLWFGFGLVAGLLLTRERKQLISPWPWLAGVIAALIFLPYVLWNLANDWPMLEFMRNATANKMAVISPLRFIGDQVAGMNILNILIWLPGLLYYLLALKMRQFRLLGFLFLAVFLLLILSKTSRASYLAPAYAWLFAGGAIAVEDFFSRTRLMWMRTAFAVILAASGILFLPLSIPVLPVETYIRYARALGNAPSTEEKLELGLLPQFYADMFGWPDLAAKVAEAYNSLSPEEKVGCLVFAANYGEAGAIDFFGKAYGLPPARSGHNNYYLWGPGPSSAEVAVVIGVPERNLVEIYKEVREGARHVCRYCMPYESDLPVYICRGLKLPAKAFWPMVKSYS